MKQQTLSEMEYGCRKKKTKREEFLEIMDEIIPWGEWVGVIRPYYPAGQRGRPPIDLELILRMYLLQVWFNLSDPGTEDAIYDSYVMRKFTGIDFLRGSVPDETTLCNFWHLLEEHGLADFVLLGHQNVGSFALSSDKTELFSLALGAFLDLICEVFNKQAIPRLIDINGERFAGITDYPELIHGDIETQDLSKLGEFVSKMVGIGAITPDSGMEAYLRMAADLPEVNPETAYGAAERPTGLQGGQDRKGQGREPKQPPTAAGGGKEGADGGMEPEDGK